MTTAQFCSALGFERSPHLPDSLKFAYSNMGMSAKCDIDEGYVDGWITAQEQLRLHGATVGDLTTGLPGLRPRLPKGDEKDYGQIGACIGYVHGIMTGCQDGLLNQNERLQALFSHYFLSPVAGWPNCKPFESLHIAPITREVRQIDLSKFA